MKYCDLIGAGGIPQNKTVHKQAWVPSSFRTTVRAATPVYQFTYTCRFCTPCATRGLLLEFVCEPSNYSSTSSPKLLPASMQTTQDTVTRGVSDMFVVCYGAVCGNSCIFMYIYMYLASVNLPAIYLDIITVST